MKAIVFLFQRHHPSPPSPNSNPPIEMHSKSCKTASSFFCCLLPLTGPHSTHLVIVTRRSSFQLQFGSWLPIVFRSSIFLRFADTTGPTDQYRPMTAWVQWDVESLNRSWWLLNTCAVACRTGRADSLSLAAAFRELVPFYLYWLSHFFFLGVHSLLVSAFVQLVCVPHAPWGYTPFQLKLLNITKKNCDCFRLVRRASARLPSMGWIRFCDASFPVQGWLAGLHITAMT